MTAQRQDPETAPVDAPVDGTGRREYRRNRPEEHKAKVRASNRARYRAVQLLIEEHRARFEQLYEEQARWEGVIPEHVRRREREAKKKRTTDLERQVAELRQQLERMERGDGGAEQVS